MNINQPAFFSLRSKKIIIILGFIIFILLVLVYIFAFPSRGKLNDTSNEPTITQVMKQSDKNLPKPTKIPNVDYVWPLYEGRTYDMQYPREWGAQTLKLADTGDIVIFRPKALPSGVIYPQFMVEEEKATDEAIDGKKGILEGLGLFKTRTDVDDELAVKYSGTIPYKTSGSQTIQEPIQDTSIVLIEGDTLYLFKFEYEGAQPNPVLDKYFDGFIQSFSSY